MIKVYTRAREHALFIHNFMRKTITIIAVILTIVTVPFVFASNGWKDFTLRIFSIRSYFTIQNNPLLKSHDADLKSIPSEKTIAPRIDLKNLLSGGPPKDGIPSLDTPTFVSSNATPFSDEEIIVGVFLHGEARAYPYGILNWHEIVNDTIGDTPITVTLCPLCDTIPVFIRKVNGKKTTFGVSGKLYQSCLVMYDRLTDSLWSQPWGLAVAGKMVNTSLPRIPAVKTTLGAWKKKHPQTTVLSEKTGHSRNYFRYPYGTYMTNSEIIFPARNEEKRTEHPKEITSYIWKADDKIPQDQFSGRHFAITHKELRKKQKVPFMFDGQPGKAVWDNELDTARFFNEKNEKIPSSTAFHFVIPAFFE